MRFPSLTYWYVTGRVAGADAGRRRGRRVVFGPAWEDVQPATRRNRFRFIHGVSAQVPADLDHAEQYMRDVGYTDIRRHATAGPCNLGPRED